MKAFPRLVMACVLFAALAANPLVAAAAPDYAARPVRPTTASARFAESTNTVVVGYTAGTESQAVKSALHLGGKNLRRSKAGRLAVVGVPAGENAADFARELSAQPGVRYAEPDKTVHLAMASNDPGFIHQWGLSRIGAPAAWDVTRGAAVKVAVLDTGVDYNHEDLIGRVDTAGGYDFVNNDSDALDDNGHGTHVAGIVSATLNNGIGVASVAPSATIIPVKVMNAIGTGSTAGVASGIVWAANHGAKVINLSLESGQDSVAIEDAVQYAVSKDCVVVAAAGNEGASAVAYPAAGPDVIGVGWTDENDIRSVFSNYGAGVDITAPGSSILSTILFAPLGSGYGLMSGTSMAAPHVAGVVALIRAKNPTWNRAMVERQLLGTALDLGAPGRDDYYGFGRVRADTAVEATVAVGALTGTVTHGGAPLSGVSVSVPECPSVLTGADGSYTIPAIIPSAYNVRYAKSGYYAQTVSVAVSKSVTTTQNVSMASLPSVSLSAPKVSGRASARTGTTLKGAIRPSHSKQITLQVRRLVNHKWRAYRTVKVTADRTGAWHVKPHLHRSTYSVRVVSAADSAYLAGASAWRTVRVR